MKWLLIGMLSLTAVFQAKGQRQFYFYFEAENGQPFYLKNADKIISSHNNYIIFSGLSDSTYQLAIGFLGSSKPESRFQLPVKAKDHGFQIKAEDGNAILYDLENQQVISSVNAKEKSTVQYQRLNDPFSVLLSRAANDSTLLYVPVVSTQDVADKKKVIPDNEISPVKNLIDSAKRKTEENALIAEIKPPPTKTPEVVTKEVVQNDNKIKDSAKAMVRDTMSIVKAEPEQKPDKKEEIKNPSLPKPEPAVANIQNTQTDVLVFKKTKIKKHAESSTSEGFGLVFFDIGEAGTDTIRLVIPNPKISLVKSDNTATPAEPIQSIDSGAIKNKAAAVVKPNPAATICRSMASDNDFYKLRKNMAAKSSDESMLSEAIKAFKSKCYTAAQVRNLGTFFLTDAGKYALFDAAYLHVSDKQEYKALANEIKDPYYVKRFQALTGDN